ncbi:E3 ubiquitin-protein ligase siah2-like isoform X2 [Chelonus insularis]|uniref:E3 ubiquitin-protein ligase siah2-like isoform X2 n=1 Tax=Chelonus insularis TaxID=460826 RepID=UPI0015897AD0|nr:E3 ubiquitin-protein ligase siah2-like isoform X2 [Chelonus insularis]
MELFKQWLSKLNQKMKREDNRLDGSMIDDNGNSLQNKSRSSEPNLKNCCDGNKFFRCYPNKACQNKVDNKDEMFRSNYLDCNCHNCMILPSITECQVCLGPFQGRNVKSCITCGNLMCNECVKKIKFCAFCRSERPFQNNKAIERLFNELSLPCKNMSDEKQDHEQKCAYSQLQCPMSTMKKCSWHGLTLDVFEHLKTAHQVVPLNGSGVTIELTDFWKKMVFAEGKYSVFLNCYYQLFLLKVDFSNGKIQMIVSRVNHFTATDEKQQSNAYEVEVKVISSNDKSHLHKTYLFKHNKHTDNIIIDCAALLAQDILDSAKIEIVVNKNNS